jgi:hypothetical protein
MGNGLSGVNTTPLIQNNASLPVYNEVIIDTPFTFSMTTAATPQPLLLGKAFKWVTSFSIRVRSMGTATYFRIGNQTDQQWELIGIGGLFGYSCNLYEVVNLANIWINSDTNDGVLEVVASYLPLSLYGNVNLALNQP